MVSFIRAHSEIPICLDTQGAQVRTGSLVGGGVTLKYGDIIEIVAAPTEGDSTRVPLYPASVLAQLAVDDLISIDFEAALLQVVGVETGYQARVLGGGPIGSNRAVSMVDRTISLPSLTESDYAAIEVGLRLNVPCFALSFANHQRDVELLRSLVDADAQIIAKIESREGLENLNGILEAADAILIDRGDLSREVALESLPFAQKEIIRRASSAGVSAYVATNLLESMVASRRPTRAEVNDVINTLADGADGLVLAAETAVGKHPVECVRMIRSLIDQYEAHTRHPSTNAPLRSPSRLIPPHGGVLVDRVLGEYDIAALRDLPRQTIGEQAMMEVKQIATGTFSPIEGFMGRETLESVLAENRLPNGTVWPMPILMQLEAGDKFGYGPGETVALTHGGDVGALLHVEECFSLDLRSLAERWFETSDPGHPGVGRLLEGGDRFVAGKVDLLAEVLQHRKPYELTPARVRTIFRHLQWERIVGFHTRNVAHRAHEYLQLTALAEHDCDGIFIHPVIGSKKPGDFSREIILKTYEHLIKNFYPPDKAVLGGFASYSRYGGPREALFTALCRKNFGCSHFIVGRDHTGLADYYPPEAAQRLLEEVEDIGIQLVFFDEVSYCQRCETHVEQCEHDANFRQHISGTQAREFLMRGEILPDWHMRESVSRLILEELRNGSEVFVA